ncbi:MAG TPA: phosphoenolpyruvate hydrolase family protein [Planctomycetota bacterium]|nr:phosphoenolpyruvate hydrolase family protein [Planctomycetota bacterium]
MTNRGKLLEAWRKKRAAGALLQGGPGGPDYLTATHLDKLGLRSASALAGLLPLGDANLLSLESTKARVATAGGTPVLAAVCATDPLRMMETFLQEIKAAGAAGVENSPSVGLVDGNFRKTLEDTRLGYDREVEMIRIAAKMDLVTAALAFSPEDARRMAEAGADLVLAHPGFADGKSRGPVVLAIAGAAREAKKGILVLAVATASDGVDGIQIE